MSISLKYTELGLTKKGEKLILEENQYNYQEDTWTMIKQFMITKYETRYVASGTMNKDFYDNYIKSKSSVQDKKVFKQAFQDEDATVDYYRVLINDPNDRTCMFSCMWLFDILDDGYLPIYTPHINTSSPFAMCMCNCDYDNDDDNDDDNDNFMPIHKIIDLGGASNFRKKTIKYLLELNR